MRPIMQDPPNRPVKSQLGRGWPDFPCACVSTRFNGRFAIAGDPVIT
jgi:hypothetical protein